MAAFTVFFMASGVASPFVGRLINCYGEKMVMSIGAAVMGIGFALLSIMSSLWQYYLFYALVGIGMAGMGTVPASSLILRWFNKSRGFAIGIMSVGVGIGGFVVAPITAGMLIPLFGWRTAYLILGMTTWLVIIPVVWLVVKASKPSDMGLYPDGIEPIKEKGEAEVILAPTARLTQKAALATSAFWLIAITVLLSQLSMVGVSQNQVPFLVDNGFPVAMAAGALGFLALMSAVGKLCFGWLCDHMKAKYVSAIGLVLQVAGILILFNIRQESPVILLWGFALTMGLGIGSWLPTMSMLVSENFGVVLYPAIFGIMTLCQCLGASIGPVVTGQLYDIMGNYRVGFIVLLALYAIALPAILFVRQPDKFK
jgi:MFS family permease